MALLALLVRAFVPAGYMLAEAETSQGRYLIVQMCDGHGGAARVIDLDTGKVLDGKPAPDRDTKNGNTNKAGAPCMFAAATPMSAPLTTIEPVAFLQEYSADFVGAETVSPGRGIAAPPPPATGPPVRI